MSRTEIRIVVAFLLFLFVGQIEAQIVTDRPDQTESSSTVGKRNLQIEAGLLIGSEGEEPISTRQILAPTTLLRLGITKGIELRFMGQLESLKMPDQVFWGISDIEFGAKFQLYQKEGSRSEVAFLTHLLLPTGPAELPNDAFGTINKLAVSHVINDYMSLGYNLGYNYLGADKGDLTYSLALGVGLGEKVGIYAEPYGEYVNLDNFLHNFNAGLTYLIEENLQLDVSFGLGLNHRMNYFSAGCSWKIEY